MLRQSSSQAETKSGSSCDCTLYVEQQFIHLLTCVVWIIVRSFIQAVPGPMAALRPAVPNSILEEKHFFKASTAPSFSRSFTIETVLGFCGRQTKAQQSFC